MRLRYSQPSGCTINGTASPSFRVKSNEATQIGFTSHVAVQLVFVSLLGDSYHSIELSERQAFYKLLTEVTSDPEWDIGVGLTKLCQSAVQVRQPIISG